MRFSLLLAALPLVFFVGCGEEALPFSTCGTSADCATGYTCTNNFCVISEGRVGAGGRDTGTSSSDTGNPAIDVGGSDTSIGSDVATLDVPVSDDTGECVPVCAGLECGEDGCGGVCGTCSGTATCVSGRCQGSTSGGDDCPDIIACINASDGSQPEFDACVAAGTSAAQGQISNLLVCIQTNCGTEGMSDEDFAACQQNFCSGEIESCTGIGTGSSDCGTVVDCLLGCPDQACGDACIGQGTPAAQSAAIGFYNCGVENCADAASLDEFLSCAEASCPSESRECDAN